MTLLGRLESALRSAWLPLAMLLLALSTVFIFGDRGYFYRGVDHNWISSEHLTIAMNLSPEHGFQRFTHWFIDDDDVTRYRPNNRFPIGGYAAMKLATLPFGGSPSAQLTAARILMLLFFTAIAVLAYLSLSRLTSNRWIALTATLLAFSSYYLLYYNDMTANEGVPDLFGVLLTFHGMVVFVQEGRFRQLLVKTCIALLLGWHVLALLLPFVIFGLARDLLRARSAASAVAPSRHLAYTLLRSRFLLLGAAALAFGLSVLTFNFTMEYVALKGETPLTELPSFQSMLKRTGADSEFNATYAARLSWHRFLEGQFRNILRMFIPYPLLGSLDHHGAADGSPTWLSEGLAVVLGIALSAACLIGSIFVRPRILFATLASFGFVWALPMRHTSAFHNFETIYYIGLPLVFFTIVLLLASRLTNRNSAIAAAAALLIFAVSSFQMSHLGHSAIGYKAVTPQVAKSADQEMLAIHELTAGEAVIVLHFGDTYDSFRPWRTTVNYYLMRSIVALYAYLPDVEGGFVVMRERLDIDALLTPQNQYFFLYDRDGLEAWYENMYRTIASTEPAARKDFDVYFDDRTVYYLREPCERTDTDARFFLHVYPVDDNDLPNDRRQYGFDNLDFGFEEHGLLFDGKCMARFVLPQYAVSKVNTGRVGQAWGVVHYINPPPELISEYQSIASNEPAARSEFDVYAAEGKLYYLKEPCERADTVARFFLHIVPEAVDDLPDARRQHGFDNLDFGFGDHGLLFGGKCMVSVDLPRYAIARITTGQFHGAGRIWEVEFAPDE